MLIKEYTVCFNTSCSKEILLLQIAGKYSCMIVMRSLVEHMGKSCCFRYGHLHTHTYEWII